MRSLADSPARRVPCNLPCSEEFKQAEDRNESFDTDYYIRVYALIGLSTVLLLLGRALSLANFRVRASSKVHSKLTHSILHAPMSFFDVTPGSSFLSCFFGHVWTTLC